jgi:hypothetical protein
MKERLMGSLFGGGQTTQTTHSDNTPWPAQQPYLFAGLDQAKANLGTANNAGPYPGSYYTGMNGIQTGGVNSASNYAATTGANLLNNTANVSSAEQGGAMPFINNAANTAANGFGASNNPFSGTLANIAANGPTSGIHSPLSAALQSAGLSGAQALQQGQGTLGSVQQAAMADPTQGTIANAQSYASSPYLQDQIRAAQTGTNNTLQESTLPGLNRLASMGGNINSSRAGMAEAMANRDAATANANTAANMSGQAYQSGLSLAAQQHEAGLNAATAAASAGNNSGNSAALGVGQLQQNQGQFGTNAMLTANGQLGAGVAQGTAAANSAGQQAAGLYGLSSSAGGLAQGDANAANQAEMNKYLQDNGGYQSNALNNYWNVAGHPLGSTTNGTSTETKPSNALGGIAGLGLLAAAPFTGGASLIPALGMLGGSSGGLGALFGGGGSSMMGGADSGLGSLLGGGSQAASGGQGLFSQTIGNPFNNYSTGLFGGYNPNTVYGPRTING